MQYLVDTHIFIWGMENNVRLPKNIAKILKDPANSIFISVASIWEMIIKKTLGKLKVPDDIEQDIKKAGFNILPIEIGHVLKVETLPNLHHDPFDRMLISQAMVEELKLLTTDKKVKKYFSN